MADGDISVSSISTKKLENAQQSAQVIVAKKASDNQGEIAKSLIEDATKSLPDGVGGKLNTVA